jgi:hypothetical protein
MDDLDTDLLVAREAQQWLHPNLLHNQRRMRGDKNLGSRYRG